jgi:DNA-binding PadR family transcriptional regulator
MFRRFAYQFQGPGEGDWTPPWLHDEEFNQHFSTRRGPFGGRGPRFFAMRHGPFGPRGPFGPMGEGHRFFGRGDVKFALLELLQERPMHGYEMMKALEEKSGGFYTPSPGSIYPTLQMLEDRGLVSVQEIEGKKVYSIADAGRAMLAERQKNDEGFVGPHGRHWHERGGHRAAPEMQALRSEAGELVRLFTIAGRESIQDPERLARLRSIIEQTRKELTDMIYGSQGEQPSSTASDKPNGPNIEKA